MKKHPLSLRVGSDLLTFLEEYSEARGYDGFKRSAICLELIRKVEEKERECNFEIYLKHQDFDKKENSLPLRIDEETMEFLKEYSDKRGCNFRKNAIASEILYIAMQEFKIEEVEPYDFSAAEKEENFARELKNALIKHEKKVVSSTKSLIELIENALKKYKESK